LRQNSARRASAVAAVRSRRRRGGLRQALGRGARPVSRAPGGEGASSARCRSVLQPRPPLCAAGARCPACRILDV